jgi:hypothetical protein
MTRQEIEAFLRLLAKWERQELALLMLERRTRRRQAESVDGRNLLD